MSEYSLLQRLRAGDNVAFSVLYDRCFPLVKNYVTRNSGTINDAEDLFQESVLILYKKIQPDSFTLSSTISAYLFSIARNTWLNQLRGLRKVNFEQIEELEYELVATEETPNDVSKLDEWMQKVTDHCQWILNAYYYMQLPLDMLMVKAGWKNKHTASNQKYKCIQMLKREAGLI